ncbi:MAG TPA: hypothetical protein VFY13_04645, partial [Luteolibacter sp.]|nr:hypothetical protein [Luteolibacter sp.]
MSMPDHAMVPRATLLQRGAKPGAWGRLLPGWFAREDASGVLRLHGPAAPIEGLRLPEGGVLDEEGFVGKAEMLKS